MTVQERKDKVANARLMSKKHGQILAEEGADIKTMLGKLQINAGALPGLIRGDEVEFLEETVAFIPMDDAQIKLNRNADTIVDINGKKHRASGAMFATVYKMNGNTVVSQDDRIVYLAGLVREENGPTGLLASEEFKKCSTVPEYIAAFIGAGRIRVEDLKTVAAKTDEKGAPIGYPNKYFTLAKV
jgi:hypothetical protein